ncbi:general secretion pathway protein J [Pseudomonas cuatrocienegasensis]|uniref:General secretion pathway protein J n=1 Tax=Pseudomonas cuatrocienegasensis TaxID=543360 RepID=A0ABY1BDF8_9PSED|nr:MULTISPECIES: prepilin-type N-terminal cleavage/methylation domain-containing protein [Pseudomonas]OEC33825.1 type II secretion pathway protein XcpW [Pseudomonas sp. 21C1]SEQ59615.1 general secretion pathway protein J [Pseudomonas cuatrocienegasensis]
MNSRQRGLTLIELMVAMALTVVLGLLLAALVNSWLQVRERLVTAERPSVLSFCLALESRFDGISLRQLYEQRLPLPLAWLDWQASLHQLQWTALSAWPPSAGTTRLQRQRLRYQPDTQQLALYSSDDLYATGTPRWVLREALAPVAQVQLSFRQGQRWLAYPSQIAAQPNLGVRIDFQYQGEPYVCTFALPDLRP